MGGVAYSSVGTPTNYQVKLPAYQGVNYKQAPCYKNSTLTKGENYCTSITGGSYAIHYQMTNSGNEIRGEYKVLPKASGTIQTFNHWGTNGYTYYLKFMNDSSVSSNVYASGLWNDDVQ